MTFDILKSVNVQIIKGFSNLIGNRQLSSSSTKNLSSKSKHQQQQQQQLLLQSKVDSFTFKYNLKYQINSEGLTLEFIPDDKISENKNSNNKDVASQPPPPSLDIQFFPTSETEIFNIGKSGHLITVTDKQILLHVDIENPNDTAKFRKSLAVISERRNNSIFSERTEESSASQYFQFYGYLSQQQNMMQDFVRTSTYQRAIHGNLSDFHGKVVLDVGAGSGILSFFAAQAGASKVYAVEASNMAKYAAELVAANHLSDKITVIAGKIEEIELPEKVDVIISEPMGYMLYNERMLETYLHAKKWLKEGGKMYPSRGDLHVAPFSDEALYMEQFSKSNFWYNTSFHGVDLSAIQQNAMSEYFRQPIVDTFDIRICMSKSVRHVVNFLDADEKDLHEIYIPLEFHVLETGTCHGLAFWFDVEFGGSTNNVWLSTSPMEPLTHWYQVRCLLQSPICVKQGQLLVGKALLVANKRQSYDVTIELRIEGTEIRSSNTLDLKNPYFRYTGMPVSAPPVSSNVSPSEIYWNQLDAQGAQNAVNMVNGISVNGMGEVAMDASHYNTNFNTNNINHPSIHPGCISSTGRSRVNSSSSTSSNNHQNVNSGGHILATSTQNAAQQQLIGGAISPSMFVNSSAGTPQSNNHHQQQLFSTSPASNNY